MKKLKINNLSKERFDKKELSKITGGAQGSGNCCCLCRYEGQGG